jgi:hypothetical protein
MPRVLSPSLALFFRTISKAVALAAITLSFAVIATAGPKSATEIAWTENTLAGLAADSSGNLFGVVASGFSDGCCGAVFEISPASGGGWTLTTIYNFLGGSDGSGPGGLIVDAAGNVYGTTSSGGSTGCGSTGCGTVFELSQGAGGVWTETQIHVFSDTEPQNGLYSGLPLVMDARGNLYGMTGGGGVGTSCNGAGCGVAFKLSRISGGGWNETVLYSFPGGARGFVPVGPLTLDAQGNLYGALQRGGRLASGCPSWGCGLVFELAKSTHGFQELVVHAFEGPDGYYPNGGLIFDAAGNLYGTTYSGGGYYQAGVAYKLSPLNGVWKEELVHIFESSQLDGSNPTAGVTFDKSGNLYGTTANGSYQLCTDDPQCSQVFKLSPSVDAWKVSAVYAIPLGYYSLGGLALGSDGNIYGAAWDNHYESGGVAFSVSP